MLRSMKDLLGYTVLATDADIGKVCDFYFHDDSRIVRYMVAAAGLRLRARKVLVTPGEQNQIKLEKNYGNSTHEKE